jgi:hypothetical protein
MRASLPAQCRSTHRDTHRARRSAPRDNPGTRKRAQRPRSCTRRARRFALRDNPGTRRCTHPCHRNRSHHRHRNCSRWAHRSGLQDTLGPSTCRYPCRRCRQSPHRRRVLNHHHSHTRREGTLRPVGSKGDRRRCNRPRESHCRSLHPDSRRHPPDIGNQLPTTGSRRLHRPLGQGGTSSHLGSHRFLEDTRRWRDS